MQQYGFTKSNPQSRKLPGTSRPCPCCSMLRPGVVRWRALKKRARREAKEEILDAIAD